MLNLTRIAIVKNLNKIISHVIFIIIFFTLITPMSFILKIFRIDRLNLKKKNKDTYWLSRKKSEIESNSFKNQY